MTELSKNARMPQCDKTAVKSRFFAQYFGTETFCGGDNHIITNVEWYTISDESYPNPHLKLKPLSKITDEDAKQLPNREYNGFSKPYESANQFLILFELMGFLTSSEADILRKLGFLIPFENNSVDDLVSFGWVQLL